MDPFFMIEQSRGLGPEMMSQMEAMMGGFGAGDQRRFNARDNVPPYLFRTEPIEIPEELIHEARFQPGYEEAEAQNDEELQELQAPMAKHSYADFEKRLAVGILDAPGLSLHQVPPSIFDNIPSIKTMHLKDNEIHELPEFFFDELPYLGWLDLRDNKLTSLPAFSTRHESLRVILLQGNRIRALPYTLALAANLRTIGLTGNPLTIPPVNVQKQGCKKMLAYLQDRMFMRVPMDESGEFEEIPSNEDQQLREDLKKTAMKSVKPKSSGVSLRAQMSGTSINSKTEEEKRAERLIYTWELWKRIPYDGKSRTDIFEKSLEEVRSQVMTKVNLQQEAILQKIKDKDALKKWRSETQLLQRTTKPDRNVNPSKSAPFGNEFNELDATESILLRPEEYKKEITECWSKLKDFASNPAPLSNTDLALKRLREVEQIQRRLLNLRISTVNSGGNPDKKRNLI